MIRSVCAAAALAVLTQFAGCADADPAGVSAPSQIEQLSIDTQAGAVQFNVEIADTEAERNQGLMFRESLADDAGMLFLYEAPEMASFWMRNTMISLDIIFIGPDGRIINIADHTTPYSDASIPAAGLTRGVLEIRAGRAAELGVRPGDLVHHPIIAAD